jgi:NOL1/NOP2/sun family putative RNA methylase
MVRSAITVRAIESDDYVITVYRPYFGIICIFTNLSKDLQTIIEKFERYRCLIEDWQGFLNACNRPLPACVWTNQLRLSSQNLLSRLRANGYEFEPVEWYPGAFRSLQNHAMGASVEYLTGLCQTQEEVAMLPALLLDPQPDDAVLDLCAAPGNKTAQMAMMMQNRGTLVANDISVARMRALRHTIDRLGLLNVTTTLQNAATFPRQPFLFDRVMADVPCSCEGTSRKNPEILSGAHIKNWRDVGGVQKAILSKALQLCKTGGRVVYATCTYAPEENEMVVHDVLEQLSARIAAVLIKPALPGLNVDCGLNRWQGRTFRNDMTHAVRIYPHQNDTGGFFIALLHKTADKGKVRIAGSPSDAASQPVNRYDFDPMPALTKLQDFYGFPAGIFAGLQFQRRNSKTVSVTGAGHRAVQNPGPQSVGLPLLHVHMKTPKLTTAAALAFGHLATRHVVELDETEVDRYLAGEDLTVKWQQVHGYEKQGHVLVRFLGNAIGMGFGRNSSAGLELTNQFPKAWRISSSQHSMARQAESTL